MASQISLNPTVWNAEAGAALAGATGLDPTYTLGDLQREIMAGVATLYEVMHGSSRLGYVVLWVEDFGGTRELVIQSGAALARDDFAFSVTIPALRIFARARGCLSMRAHVSNSAALGRLKRGGFHRAETVMRSEV